MDSKKIGVRRYGDVECDCKKARHAYEQAKRKGLITSERKNELGLNSSGQIARLLGRDYKQGRESEDKAWVTASNLKHFADLCGVTPDYLAPAPEHRPTNKEDIQVGGMGARRSTAAPIVHVDSPALLIHPVTGGGNNVVHLGRDNHVAGASFTFFLLVNLIRQRNPFILMGFRADYIVEGCYCENEPGDKITVNGRAVTRDGDLDFTPVPIDTGIAKVAYSRKVRPPTKYERPRDCDYGDVEILVRALSEETPVIIRQFFRFGAGGDLIQIATPNEPKNLPDSVLFKMLDKGVITPAEFERARSLDAATRHQVIKYGDYHDFHRDITEEFREFLRNLQRRSAN